MSNDLDLDPLDKAFDGETSSTSKFEEEYPDAPEWAVEMSKQLEENRKRIARKRAARKQTMEELAATLKERVATMAVNAGVATDEEKALVRKMRGEKSAGSEKLEDRLGARQKFFVPDHEREYQS
jgi:hypothetical protein